MPKEWTPERRAAQAERIRAAKPWLKSTGPKTKAGKKRSSENALKHGKERDHIRLAKKMMRLNRQFLKAAVKVMEADLEVQRTNYRKGR